jgi:hypothetical protein
MPFLIGTDEAGYAPNLGPLVISASVWWVEDAAAGEDLYKPLRSVVCRAPLRKQPLRRVAIGDSKALYRPPHGLSLLERGVLAALGTLDCFPLTWDEIWQALDADATTHLGRLPWHVDYCLKLPAEADGEELVALVPKLRRGFEKAGVRLIAVRSAAVFPERFNQCTDQFGNKGEALSKLTLGLVEQLLELCPGESVLIVCDKHGGRNHYGRLLQEQFPDPLVEVRRESPAESVYCWGPPHRRIEIRFRMGGEEFLPAALASMASKYLRELAMRAFNDFWCTRVPQLQPTAGYPVDAVRFKAAIRETQAELGIDDRILWRAR